MTTTVGQAFGLRLEGVEIFGSAGVGDLPVARRCRMTIVRREDIDRRWERAASRQRGSETRADDGDIAFALDFGAGVGFRFSEPGCDTLLAEDGTDVMIGPGPRVAAEDWQRLLVGQVLPFAAVLQGLEVLHASCVAIGEMTIAVVAAPGMGKSSLAGAMVARGAELVTDDVLAVEAADDGRVMAHPGSGLLKLRPRETARLGSGRAVLGDDLGEFDDGRRILARVVERPRALTHLVVLSRSVDPEQPPLRLSNDVGASYLIGATFNLLLRSPARMRRQLDLAAAIGTSVDCLHADVGPAMNADQLAEALLDYVGA